MKSLSLAALLLLGPGCASYSSWRFGPSPQDHEILVGDPAILVVRAQVAVRGLEEVSDDAFGMRFGLRVQNQTAQTIELASDACELVDADLRSFGRASVVRETPGKGLSIGAKETAVFDVAFPLPSGVSPDDLDLSGLSLRFGVIHEGRTLTANAYFERLSSSDSGGWGTSVGFGVGFVDVD